MEAAMAVAQPVSTPALEERRARRRASDRRNWQRQYQRAKELWAYQMVRLDHDDAKALRELAKRKGVAVAELIRTYVAWGLENDYGGADAD
jgi:hypothetical protein